MKSKIYVKVIVVLCVVISTISMFVCLYYLFPNRLDVIDASEQTSFTATIIEITESNDFIDIRLDFHDHTIFIGDTFRMDSYNYLYAVSNGFLNDVTPGDTITILTSPYNGPYYFYEIYALEKDDIVYLSVQNTNEGLEAENEINEIQRKDNFLISGVAFLLFGLTAGIIWWRYNHFLSKH